MDILRLHGYALEAMFGTTRERLELKRRAAMPPRAGRKPESISRLILALTAPHFLFYKRPEMDDSPTPEKDCGEPPSRVRPC